MLVIVRARWSAYSGLMSRKSRFKRQQCRMKSARLTYQEWLRWIRLFACCLFTGVVLFSLVKGLALIFHSQDLWVAADVAYWLAAVPSLLFPLECRGRQFFDICKRDLEVQKRLLRMRLKTRERPPSGYR